MESRLLKHLFWILIVDCGALGANILILEEEDADDDLSTGCEEGEEAKRTAADGYR
jgi:hypothetical protein